VTSIAVPLKLNTSKLRNFYRSWPRRLLFGCSWNLAGRRVLTAYPPCDHGKYPSTTAGTPPSRGRDNDTFMRIWPPASPARISAIGLVTISAITGRGLRGNSDVIRSRLRQSSLRDAVCCPASEPAGPTILPSAQARNDLDAHHLEWQIQPLWTPPL
jgi:hypothetical protein